MTKLLLIFFVAIGATNETFAMKFYDDGTPMFELYEKNELDSCYYLNGKKRELNHGTLLQSPYLDNVFNERLKDATYQNYSNLANHSEKRDKDLSILFCSFFKASLGDTTITKTDREYESNKKKLSDESLSWKKNTDDEGHTNFKYYTVGKTFYVPLRTNSPHYTTLQENDVSNEVRFWHAIEDTEFHKEIKSMKKSLLIMKRNLNNVSFWQWICNYRAYQNFKKQQHNLEDEITWLTDKKNRDAFSRMHVPPQYFQQFKKAQVIHNTFSKE